MYCVSTSSASRPSSSWPPTAPRRSCRTSTRWPTTDVSNPARLLFDTPGARTAKLNTDLFRRRAADDTVLSLPAAAIALYVHMSWCASDGVGYRVALRGGGPLVTLPVLGHRRFGDTLWGQAWPAVRIAHDEDPDWAGKPEKVFAWLAPTRTSRPGDGNPPLGPDDMHALHVHWGMPRRVRLLTGPAAGRACAVTGERAATAIVGVRMRNYGIDYAPGYRHPHTPRLPRERQVPAAAGAGHRAQRPRRPSERADRELRRRTARTRLGDVALPRPRRHARGHRPPHAALHLTADELADRTPAEPGQDLIA